MRSKAWWLWRAFVEVFLFVYDVLVSSIIVVGLFFLLVFGHSHDWRLPW